MARQGLRHPPPNASAPPPATSDTGRNLSARNLRLGRTRTALLVVPALTNEFFARVYTG